MQACFVNFFFHGRMRNTHEEQQLPERKHSHSHSSFPLSSSSIISNPASAVRVRVLSRLQRSRFCLQLAWIHHMRPTFCTVPYCPTCAHQNKPSSQIFELKKCLVHKCDGVMLCACSGLLRWLLASLYKMIPKRKGGELYNRLCTNVSSMSEYTMKLL